MTNIRRGQVWYHTPSYETTGHIYKGRRPVVIVSNDQLNANSSVVLAVPCTSKPKRNYPTHVMFSMNGESATAMTEQAGPVNVADLTNHVYTLERYIVDLIDVAVQYSYGILPVPKNYPYEEALQDNTQKSYSAADRPNETEPIYNKWTVEKMEQFIEDYNGMGRQDLLDKYKLANTTATNYYGKFVAQVGQVCK